jgi:hypothetical protein
MESKTKIKNLRTSRRFERKAILLYVFSYIFLSTHYNYASDYKAIYRPQVIDKQGIKLLKENPNLNRNVLCRLN